MPGLLDQAADTLKRYACVDDQQTAELPATGRAKQDDVSERRRAASALVLVEVFGNAGWTRVASGRGGRAPASAA
jgi:hypothetical protein